MWDDIIKIPTETEMLGRTMRSLIHFALIGGALVAALGEPAVAQDYPTRPVTFVVPYAPEIGRAHV